MFISCKSVLEIEWISKYNIMEKAKFVQEDNARFLTKLTRQNSDVQLKDETKILDIGSSLLGLNKGSESRLRTTGNSNNLAGYVTRIIGAKKCDSSRTFFRSAHPPLIINFQTKFLLLFPADKNQLICPICFENENRASECLSLSTCHGEG